MSQERFDRAQNILTNRLVYEQKLRMYYTMRHDGLPRLNKPFESAADAHYPLIDMDIRKMKPFWMGQVTSGERLCSFTSMQSQPNSIAESAADYFDYTVRQRTRFMRKLRVAVDHMLLKGRGILKITVDPTNDYEIVVEAIDPFFMLMPQECDGFEDADEWIHCRQFTVENYKRLDKRWDTSDATIAAIRGKPVANQNVNIDQKRIREGINYSTNAELIIVWEHWIKNGAGHSIETYSPLAPEIQLRATHGNPYKFQNKESIPFFSFQMEVKDEGWYSPRGIAELIAPVEQYMTKLWNEKADAMTFANRQIFTGDKEIINSANYRWMSGEYMPGNIKQVQMASAPFNFDEELGFAQSVAEQQTQSPDFGITQPGQSGDTGGKPRTATENERISALQQSGTNDNGLMFREDLLKAYKHIWGLICQFKQRDLSYFSAGQVEELPTQAVHDSYLMEPDGSPDGWNPMARFQKSVAGMQTFAGNPNVNPEILTKDALSKYDSRVALKAFVPTNLKGASEYEDQAMVISALLAPGSGKPPFPVTVKPSDDHLSRIKANIDWLHACGKLGTPLDPLAQQRVHANTAQHIAILQKQNPAAAKEVAAMIQQLEQATGQPGGQPNANPSAQAPANVAGNPAPSPSGNANESISINYKDAPADIQRQMESKAGFVPSKLPPPAPVATKPPTTSTK